jgi:histidinol-phosphate aminotransferase
LSTRTTPERFPLPAHLEGLDRYEPGRPIEEVRRVSGLRDVVKLASNENPLGPSPLALAAARAALERAHVYPEGPAPLLRAALAARLGVEAGQVVVGNGSTDLIDLLARALLGPSHNAVISEGAFARYRQVVRARNGNARLVPMRGRTHDLVAMADAVDDHTRLVYVANPNNPTGTWNRREEVEALVAGLPPSVLLVLDEAYFEYVDEPDYPDGVQLVRRGAPVVVLRTFSKAHGLAGLRVGYGVAAPAVVDAIDTVREPFNSNAVGQAAALGALGDAEHVRRTVELCRRERERVRAALTARGLEVPPSLGNFLFVDTARPGGEVFRRLLEQGVIVRPMAAYGFPRCLRISLGTAEEDDRLLAALDRALAEIPPA